MNWSEPYGIYFNRKLRRCGRREGGGKGVSKLGEYSLFSKFIHLDGSTKF